MDCRTVLKLNEQYLAGELPDSVLAEYLDHIENCASCMDNLMTDYSITKAIYQINHNQDFSTDYSKELNLQLARSRQSLVRKKRNARYRLAIALGLMALSIPLMAGSTYGKAKYYLPEGSEESLRLGYYGLVGEEDPVMQTIRELNDEAVIKLRQLSQGGVTDDGR